MSHIEGIYCWKQYFNWTKKTLISGHMFIWNFSSLCFDV